LPNTLDYPEIFFRGDQRPNNDNDRF
jgi:hypothetical protein